VDATRPAGESERDGEGLEAERRDLDDGATVEAVEAVAAPEIEAQPEESVDEVLPERDDATEPAEASATPPPELEEPPEAAPEDAPEDVPAPPLPAPAVPSVPRSIPIRLGACLARLDEGIAASRVLGLDVEEAEATRREADDRLSLSADVCFVALIGGTGVGKSTLLNAVAGTEVSAASARRPTTGQPVAWIPAGARDEIAPVLEWLEVDEVLEHPDTHLPSVAILDLPDLDSVAREHRERVESLLPRVDAVIWVSDPEKYRDAVLHEDFLRRWLPRLDRQLVVLNKADRLSASDVDEVRSHFARSLLADLPPERATPPDVVAVSAIGGDVAAVQDWLNAQADAKRVVTGRISASVVDGLEHLAQVAGVNPDVAAPPILDPAARKRSIDAATNEVLRLVDLPSATRQAVAATRAAARPRGAGPLGKITAWLYRSSGRQARVADPGIFLRAWMDRGSLAPALDALRSAVDEPLRTTPGAIRPVVATSVDGRRLQVRLRSAVDGAIASPGPLIAPTSRVWPLLGVLQTIATAALVIAIAWLALVVILRPPVDLIALPLVGRVPAPFVVLVAALIAAFIVARLLSIHAGWLGRRWASSVASEVRVAVQRAVADEAFAPLDRVDTARRSLWLAARGARDACGRR
jgi:energy-coupling factor transporter ATP-binding protein EcfA2